MRREIKGFIAAGLTAILCLPVLGAGAGIGKLTEYSVEYIGRDETGERLLEKVTLSAPAGRIINVPHKDFENYEKEKGQDMTLYVSAGGAEKKIFYERLFYDRIVFDTQGSYISPIYGWAGEDISEEVEKIKTPVRQGYIFKGWDKELPEIMPEGEYVVSAVWEPGESRYTVLRWMENAEDDGYRLLGEKETRTAPTGSIVSASGEDIDRAGEMADWFPDSEYYRDFYGFDYDRCEETEVTADGRAVLNLYYKREIWTINLHEETEHESGASDALLPNDDVWYTASGKYGSALPDDFPSFEELERRYMGKTQLGDVKFLGVRDEFDAVGRHLDTFYFQDLAKGNHTFDAYPWMEKDAYPVYIVYFKEGKDGTFRRVRRESVLVEKDPAVYGAEVKILHPKGLTFEGGWFTTGATAEECEQDERYPISSGQARSDGEQVFRNISSYLYLYMKRDSFSLNYMDVNSEGENVILRTERVTYKDESALDYRPEADGGQVFKGWYFSPAPSEQSEPVEKLIMPAEDINVYAGWDAAVKSVKFAAGTDTADPPEQNIKAGGCAAEPQAPVKAGYVFLGWFREPGGNDSRLAWDFREPVEEDVTLYAGWRSAENVTYTVRHVVKGAEEAFRTEEGYGRAGDIIYVRPLLPGDEEYPAGENFMSMEEGRKIVLNQEADKNEVLFLYERTDASDSNDSAGTVQGEPTESPEKNPETLPGGALEDAQENEKDKAAPETGDKNHGLEKLLCAAAIGALSAAWILSRRTVWKKRKSMKNMEE